MAYPMDLTSTSFSGLPTHILSQVEQNLQIPVSRELHAFCHLCLPDAPAATELVRFSKDELSEWSQLCKKAIDQWCCFGQDYKAQLDDPSLTHRSSILIARTKDRDRYCIISGRKASDCQGAHIFPYSLGKSQEWATRDIWKVLEMFLGRERKDQLLELIFGPKAKRLSNSKPKINALYNMIMLSAEVHISLSLGNFTLEPLEEEASPEKLKVRFQWMPKKSESPKELGIAADPTSIERIPFTASSRLFNVHTSLRVRNGDIAIFTTNDTTNAPVPHRDLLMLQFFLISVLCMAGRVGKGRVETLDSDDEVSSLATSNAGSTEQQ